MRLKPISTPAVAAAPAIRAFRSHRRYSLALGLTAGLLAMTQSASAIYIRDDHSIASYTTLVTKPAFSPIGYLTDLGWGGYSAYASATLVSPTKVLTAAHVFDEDGDGKIDDLSNVKKMMFGTTRNVPGYVKPNVASAVVNPLYKGANAAYDLAVITLKTPITNVTPAKLSSVNMTGRRGGMIGYGYQGTGKSDDLAGTDDKLAALNIISKLSNGTYLTDFDSPSGKTSSYDSKTPLTYEGTTAPGDSGSPLMADFGNDIWKIVGVLNGGYNPIKNARGQTQPDSWYGDVSVYASLANSQNASFLKLQGLTISSSATGASSLETVGQRTADVVPEPAGLAALVPMLGLLARRRHRRA